MREQIDRLAAVMRDMPQVSLPTIHYFANGMYCRACEIKAGIAFVGQEHAQQHFFMLVKGAVTLTDGGQARNLYAPAVLVSEAGTKRAGIAIEDCIFLTIHRTDSTDIEEIRREIANLEAQPLFDANNKVLPGVLLDARSPI